MSRRASDKMQNRLGISLVILATLSSVLAAVIGFKAISALDKFDAFIDAATRAAERKSLLPEGY